MKPNEDLITDGFWLIILKKNKTKFICESDIKEYELIKKTIKDRMAINYVDYIASCAHIRESDKDLFFQIYFDIVAQGVFYSFFYAFPKSRNHFNDAYKKYIFNQFTMFFTGLKISNKSKFRKDWKFIEDWCLDLGAGNVLKMNQNDQEDKEKTSVLPHLSKFE